MLAKRFALAFGLFSAVAASQLPEYTQQYRQRLGGAIDELQSIMAEFDAEAARLSLDRATGIKRLIANSDPLARQRGEDLDRTAMRETQLEHQQADFATADPLSQYWVLFDGLDNRVAARAYADFQPAVPVTSAGLLAALSGLVVGWGFVHCLFWPFRRRRPVIGQKPVKAWR